MENKGIQPARQQPNISLESGWGGFVKIVKTERSIVIFGITENELENISYFNSYAIIWFSVCSFLLTCAIGFIVNCLAQKQPTEFVKALAFVVSPVFIILAIVFLFVALSAIKKRKSTFQKVKIRSREIE